MKKTVFALLVLFGALGSFAQSPTCSAAEPLCAGGADVGNSTNVPSLGAMNCLGSTPNPVWYYSLAQTSGSITLTINQIDVNGVGRDVDYAVWGPYSSLSSATNAGCTDIMDGSPPTPLSCSYSASATETATFNVVAGQYYIILMTNYSNQVGMISIHQTGGTGVLDCSVLVDPACQSRTADFYTSTSGGSAYLNMVESCLDGQIDFWISMTFPTTDTITYTISGTAVNGVDYNTLSGIVVLPAGQNHGVVNINPIADGLAEGPETVTLTFYTPCDSLLGSATMTILDGTPHSASASQPMVCPGGAVLLTATGGSGYSWRPPGAVSNSSIANPTAIVNSTTTYYVDITQPSCPILVTDSVTVTVDSVPITITGALSYCEGANTTLTASGAASYMWGPPINNSNPTITVTAGTYMITANSAIGCTGTQTVVVVENPTPYVTIDGILNYCQGSNTTLTANGGVTYAWAAPLSSYTASVTVTAGTYTVSATDVNGCTGTATAVVTANAPTVVTIDGNPSFCSGDSTVLVASGGYNYAWDDVGNTASATITINTAGTYTVTTTDINGCSGTASITTIINPSPIINLGVAKNSCCKDVILNPSPDTTLNYLWSSGDTTESVTIFANDSTKINQIYTLTVTNQYGCTAMATDTVNIWCINAQGTAFPDTIYIGSTPNNESTLSVLTQYDNGNYTYTWLPADINGTFPLNSPTVVVSPLSTTTYTVHVVDNEYGCMDSTTIYLVVIEPGEVAMPSAFTPNGDGVNDIYFPVYFSKQAVLYDFRIYNRWGEIVHKDPNSGWDGKYKGEEQPTEVYTYYIYIEVPDKDRPGQQKTIKKEGSFTLLR